MTTDQEYEIFITRDELWVEMITIDEYDSLKDFFTTIKQPFQYEHIKTSLCGISIKDIEKKMFSGTDFSLERTAYKKFKEIGYIKAGKFHFNDDLKSRIELVFL